MRIRILAVLSLVLTGWAALGDEKLPMLKVGSETYSNVLVTSVTASDVFFTSDQGMGNVKLKNLDPELQRRFQRGSALSGQSKVAESIYHFRVLNATNPAPVGADVKAELTNAILKVRLIINQPVRRFNPTTEIEVSTYRPGWFHAGAIKPDFNTVDVRKTQEFPYRQNKYVTSDLNPGVVFFGEDLEFNAMTKYFYLDRSLPKKRLTEAEMVEINRLYRIIGEDEEKVAHLPNQ